MLYKVILTPLAILASLSAMMDEAEKSLDKISFTDLYRQQTAYTDDYYSYSVTPEPVTYTEVDKWCNSRRMESFYVSSGLNLPNLYDFYQGKSTFWVNLQKSAMFGYMGHDGFPPLAKDVELNAINMDALVASPTETQAIVLHKNTVANTTTFSYMLIEKAQKQYGLCMKKTNYAYKPHVQEMANLIKSSLKSKMQTVKTEIDQAHSKLTSKLATLPYLSNKVEISEASTVNVQTEMEKTIRETKKFLSLTIESFKIIRDPLDVVATIQHLSKYLDIIMELIKTILEIYRHPDEYVETHMLPSMPNMPVTNLLTSEPMAIQLFTVQPANSSMEPYYVIRYGMDKSVIPGYGGFQQYINSSQFFTFSLVDICSLTMAALSLLLGFFIFLRYHMEQLCKLCGCCQKKPKRVTFGQTQNSETRVNQIEMEETAVPVREIIKEVVLERCPHCPGVTDRTNKSIGYTGYNRKRLYGATPVHLLHSNSDLRF